MLNKQSDPDAKSSLASAGARIIPNSRISTMRRNQQQSSRDNSSQNASHIVENFMKEEVKDRIGSVSKSSLGRRTERREESSRNSGKLKGGLCVDHKGTLEYTME